MFSVRTILCPVDFSDCSRYAFRLAGALARGQNSRLVVLHVSQKLGPMVANGEALAELQPKEYKEWLWKVLQRFQIRDAKINIEHRLVEGDPTREILKMAEETSCDVIVMGTHGRTRLQRMLMGSVAEQVLRKARCPVVAVKTPKMVGSLPSAAPKEGAAKAESVYII